MGFESMPTSAPKASEQPTDNKKETPEDEQVKVFYKEKAKKLAEELGAKYEIKKIMDWESQQFPLEVTDKVKEIITDENDLASYEEFAQAWHMTHAKTLVDEYGYDTENLRENLKAKAKGLAEELGAKYEIKKIMDWESQQYPLEVTDKVKEIITDENDQALYKEFAQAWHAAYYTLKSKDETK